MAIIISQNGKNAKKIDKSSFDREDYLQEYLHNNPESIPLYDIKEDIRLLILAREFPTGSGPIDELGVDHDGELYPVETKLLKNPDKREVVAQVLDYGSSLWHTYADFNEFVRVLDEKVNEKFGMSLHQKLKEFFELDDEGVATLLDNMKRNLSNGNFRFVVLMDQLESRLKDLIVFLNQNSKFDIFAVELEYYKHEEYEIMIPKLFGAEVKKDVAVASSGPRRQWNEAMFFEEAKKKITNKRTFDILTGLYEFTKQNADLIEWGSGEHKGSFSFKLEHSDSKSGVISLIDLRTNGIIIFRFGNIQKRIGKEAAGKFYDKLSTLSFIQKWPRDEVIGTDWYVKGELGEVLPDEESIGKLRSAILEFKDEIKK